MPHYIRYLLLSIMLIGLSGCCYLEDDADQTDTQPQAELVWKDVKLPHFSRINASDNVHMTIRGNRIQEQNVRIFAGQVLASVHDDTLFLIAAPLKEGESTPTEPVNVKALVGELKDIQLFGNATLMAKNIHSQDLTLNDNTAGNVELVGVLGLRHINQYREGSIKAHWLQSPDLTIYSNSGTIKLAGQVDHLRVKLDHTANLQARNLRTKDIWIATNDQSKASITPLDDLQAFATDDSEILYHHHADQSQTTVEKKARVLFVG